uniref:STI1 domain-containing protein n=1 Tax=Chlamydomonas leiostraca TaxID=1034604 RepID=A0A7S0RRP4_9CHLO|mmetsp:Transcript_28789/g.73364  ORF Transcript_28789/g.73364 Transcript_28789/m.73364 type:complete len:578 (+) Transcript_28789:38-1771(+)|eukprot:CAMPEP_0202866364 /NCGR_PEP_ID=MMETSP1391-20130828/7342_1 /ASSEMBLY_ACC=CAM_ASM_000867 /TAXON_ID=1034604 /ORGANISM="Chlamydomonas leiostraca, Strain SAG 11-49" /LENGTH=577 /DNA_ID=CAMNT_0049546301 /DNA_START=38 /DNA_END=1771 /DNA_ORIENTATION=-
MADELKAKGNAAFSAGQYEEAVKFFSDAIAIDPNNHVLHSNRSAAQASLNNYESALEDARKCVSIKPDWGKGYSRLGVAFFHLHRLDEAIKAYEDGLTHDPANEQLKSGLADARTAKEAPPPPRGPFSSPEVLTRLAMDPRTRPLLGQADFMSMLKDVQGNPQNMSKYLPDARFQLLLEVALGLKMAAPGEEGGAAADHGHDHADDGSCCKPDAPKPQAAEAHKPAPAPAQPAEAPEVDMDASGKAAALKEKEAGNEAYKAKRFDEAITHYNKALELYDGDISFLTNRAAVFFETGQYDKCMEDCDKAVERGRELRADYKLVAKAMARKGSALAKLERLEEAIAVFNKSLTEHRNADTLKKLNDAEKALKDKREREYIDMALSNEEKDKGNAAFKEARYPEAVAHYNEALKRGPPAVNPEAHKLYSNLAACYTKLGAYPDGIKVADKCIELAPTFAKGYSRKGTLQFLCKEYEKAVETYNAGLKHDPDNEELQEGIERCIGAISRFASGHASAEEVKERQARAMADPDVQNILKDPVMQNVLRDFQEDPKAAQHHLKSPDIMRKLNKLVAAGIVQMK